jgi:chromosome segregation ATPase
MAEQELVDLIKNGLSDLAQRIEESRRETREQFERVDGRLAQIDGRFAQTDGRFAQIDGRFAQIDGRFAQIDGRFEHVEGSIRQVHVLIEGLDAKIELVAEGVSNVEEKLDRNIKANEQQFEELRTTIQISHAVLQKRDDDLDARVTVLETSRR